MKTEERRKKAAGVSAVVLAAALVLTGTFAWQSISQHALDENITDITAGGRIHDDWNGENKDVYAENFTSTDDSGKPLFVRIRLMEFMETGADAGDLTDADGDDVLDHTDRTSLVAGTTANKTEGWRIRKPGETDADNPFLKYWDWTWGEGTSTVYMPTFNLNKESKRVDVNGTYEGQTGTTDHYDDYHEYSIGESKTATEYYYAEAGDTGAKAGNKNNVISGTETAYYTEKTGKEHIAKETDVTEQIMTMDEWVSAGYPLGKYWVWDDDGWFYWAEPLYPGETTGLLLDEVQQKSYLSDTNYYGINVMGEFASANDWGDKNDKTGFYETSLTDEAKDLLDRTAKMVKGADGKWYQSQGYNLYYKLNESGANKGQPDTSDLICAGADTKIGNGDDTHNHAMITLTSDLKVDNANYGKLFLQPSDPNSRAASKGEAYLAPGSDQLFGTADDLKLWYAGLDFKNETNTELFSTLGMQVDGSTKYLERIAPKNVYQKVTSGTLGSYYWVGADGEIGTSDDKEVIKLNQDLVIQWKADDDSTKTNYGKWFLVPSEDSDSAYVSAGKNEKFETEGASDYDDVKIWYTGSNFPSGDESDFSITGNYTMTISAAGSATTAAAGKTLKFTAEVYRDGSKVNGKTVNWSVTGGTAGQSGGTSIANDGTLTVGALETKGTTLTVKAALKGTNVTADDYKVTVEGPDAVTLTAAGNATEIEPGKTLQFTAGVTKGGSAYATQAVNWTLGGTDTTGASLSSSGVLNVTSNATAGAVLKVTATSQNDPSVSKTVEITVAKYTVDVSVSGNIWAGSKPTFTATLKRNGTAQTGATFTWTGTAVNSSTGVLTIPDTATDGTSYTVTATSTKSSSWNGSKSVKVVGPDSVTVTPSGQTVEKGKTLQMSAAVKKGSTTYTSQKVSWTVSGNKDSNTKVSSAGLLTIGSSETSSTITVKATSVNKTSLSGSQTVTVKLSPLPDATANTINGITAGSSSTVTIDGVEFYVLAKQSGKALLMTKNAVKTGYAFGTSNNQWKDSQIRTWLNDTWLPSLSTLKKGTVVPQTTIYTVSTVGGTDFYTTSDYAFLLSEADVFGTNNGSTVTDSRFYTTGGTSKLSFSPGWILESGSYWWWLRSPRYSSLRVAGVYGSGGAYYYDYGITSSSGAVRPALWVNL